MTIMANTIYGAAVGFFRGKEVYLCRRIDTPLFPKKWQFANGRLHGTEQSQDAAVRIMAEQTGIKIDRSRLNYVTSLTINETNEFYYIYLVHLEDSEIPVNMDMVYKSDWKLFSMKASVVLDLVPGIRHILLKLHRALIKFEAREVDSTSMECTDQYI